MKLPLIEKILSGCITLLITLQLYTDLPVGSFLVITFGILAFLYQIAAPSLITGAPVWSIVKKTMFNQWALFTKLEMEGFNSAYLKTAQIWGLFASISLVSMLFKLMKYPGGEIMMIPGAIGQLIIGGISAYFMLKVKSLFYQKMFFRCLLFLCLMGMSASI